MPLSIFAALLIQTPALAPGDPAPKLAIRKWLKGTPIKALAKDRTYVVEFWATWCGPCKEAMPHLSQLQKANPDVTFLGVGILEDDVRGNLKRFVDRMGDRMAYRVAYSGNTDGMAQTWMKAFGKEGIPATFVVKGGRVQWIGHPDDLERALARIKAGRFEVAAFRKEYALQLEARRHQAEIRAALDAAMKTWDDGRRAEGRTELLAVGERFPYPEVKGQIDAMLFIWDAYEDFPAWEKKAAALARSPERDPFVVLRISGVGLRLAYEGRLDDARRAADLAAKYVEDTDTDVLLALLETFGKTGDDERARRVLDRALKGWAKGSHRDDADERKRLEAQKKALDAKRSASG